MTTFIFYATVGRHKYTIGLRLPASGVAMVAGALLTLASAIFFYAGSFSGSIVYGKEIQRLAEQDFERAKAEVKFAKQMDHSLLHAARGKLGELHGRLISLGARGESLAHTAGYGPTDPPEGELAADAAVRPEAGSTAAK